MEIGILGALGYRSGQMMMLFLSKSLLIGLVGALLGCVAGSLGGCRLGVALESNMTNIFARVKVFRPLWLFIALAASPMLSILAGWIPALFAALQDPAEILRKK